MLWLNIRRYDLCYLFDDWKGTGWWNKDWSNKVVR